MVDRLIEAGRPADALARIERAFTAAPSLAFYRRLRDVGGEAAGERGIAALGAALRGDAGGRHADLLLQILVEERRFDEAWSLADLRRPSPGRLESLAAASEATHPARALAVHEASVETMVASGSRYAQAAALVARMARLRDAGAQAAYVADLKSRHARRRNFMKLLA